MLMFSRDVSEALCLSLACYSCADIQALLGKTPTSSGYPPIDDMVACGSSWPDLPGGVGMNVRYHEGRNTFPLSPPYFVRRHFLRMRGLIRLTTCCPTYAGDAGRHGRHHRVS